MNAGRVYRGVGVGSVAVVGRIVRYEAPVKAPADEPIPADDAARDGAEQAIRDALAAVAADLRQAAASQADATLAEVLDAASQMADDPELVSRAIEVMRAGAGPATAVTRVIGEFEAMFTAIGGYMAERVSDLRSVRDRAVAALLGVPMPSVGQISPGSIIVARELTPADTSNLDLDQVAGLITEEGGPTSHVAIIARAHGVACVVQAAGVTGIGAGSLVALDSASGTVTVDPSAELRDRIAARAARRRAMLDDRAPGATADGHPIALLANIGTGDDARRAAQTAAEGVGLLRTEFMFLDAATEPSVDDQCEQYRQVLECFKGRKIVVRTLDAGADKPLPYANTTPEDNPALGVRAYRLVRRVPGLLDRQLEALARAARAVPEADVWVMAPMISTPAEAAGFRQRAAEVGFGVGVGKVGVMVEVPGLALRADLALASVDFASIGTNDLAQYAMAADRQNGELADLLNPWQPAVLQLVAVTAAAGAGLGRPVGVCGESASDPLMALVLCGLGVTSLSMSPAALPEVRDALRHTTFARCQQMAHAALSAASAIEAREAVIGLAPCQVSDTLAD